MVKAPHYGKKILIFTYSNILTPSSRIRGVYVAKYLSKSEFDSKVILYESAEGSVIKKILHIGKDFLRKIGVVIGSNRETLIYIQKGVCSLPQLSLIFSLFSKFILRKKVIYDIDDGLFLKEPFVINNLIRFSDLVVVGGHELFNYTKKYNENVILIPTSADLKRYSFLNAFRKGEYVRLGFVGSPSTTKYLRLLLKPLGELAKSHDFELRVISAPSYTVYKPFKYLFKNFEKRGVKVKLIPWSLQGEFHQLQNIDIGLAPLFDGEWEKYKCGFKVINYMAAGIPPVASDVGEHSHIIQDGVNGFLCKNDQQWIEKLRKLIEDENLREKMGANARKTVEEKYSLERNAKNLAKVLAKLF